MNLKVFWMALSGTLGVGVGIILTLTLYALADYLMNSTILVLRLLREMRRRHYEKE